MSFDIQRWLADIGLPQYIDTFRDQGIDDLSLTELTDVDLRELGVSAMGHRKTILREAAKVVENMRLPKAQSSTPTVIPQTIFLSYAHKSERNDDLDFSEDLVLLIQQEFEQDGHTVWIDKDGIRAGSQWRERITSAILDHTHFLSFLSVRSVRDPGVCLNEIAIALGGNKHIQTVLAEDERRVVPPLTISHVQWHDFQHWREIRDGIMTGPMGENWANWFGQRMTRLREVIADEQNARIPGELQKLREILEPRTFEARIVEKTQGFSGRKWLFEEAGRWLEESTSRMFWLKAGPGIGKSSFAAQLTHQARSAVVGFFMCDFQGKKDPEESAREAVCTLTFQLASRLPDYRVKLLYGLKLNKDNIVKRTADELFEYLITEPLNRVGKIPENTRFCLVVDGLDEAGRAEVGNSLADLLAKHAERLPEWLGVLVTSRPEPYLEQALKPLSSMVIDGQSTQNRQDLADWIDARLPKSLEGEERQRVIDAVIDKSGGTFLYLSLVEKDKTLDLTKPDSLPDQLDGIFKQNFNRYFPNPEQYGEKIEPFLRLMAASPGPLPAQMGAEILGWAQRRVTIDVIEPMGSLLQEDDDGLKFFHPSLVDWLQNRKRSGRYCLEESGARLLSEFIWQQLERLEATQWTKQVVNWLAILLPNTQAWGSSADLREAVQFLEEHYRQRDAVAVRKKELALIRSVHTELSGQFAESLYSLALSQSVIGDSVNALDNLRCAQRIYAQLPRKDADAVDWVEASVWISLALGDLLSDQDSLAEALVEYRKALELSESLISLTSGNDEYEFNQALSHNRIGIILEAAGELVEALQEQRRYQSIFEKLSAADTDRLDWQNHLASSCSLIGSILQKQGFINDALAEFARAVDIAKQLAKKCPDDTDFQTSLALYLVKVGGVLELTGDLDGALGEFREALNVREQLVRKSPEHLEWRRNLGVSFNRIGGVLESQGDLEGALQEQRKYQAVFEFLVAEDPGSVVYLNNLGISCSRVGRILELQGNLEGALSEQLRNRKIFEQLNFRDPDNTNWMCGLGISHNRIGSVLYAQGDLSGAIISAQEDLAITLRLTEKVPDNVFWQGDLAISYSWIGVLLEERGNFDSALCEFRKAVAIFNRLITQVPGNVDWLQQLCTLHSRMGELLQVQGDLVGALNSFKSNLEISEQLALLSPQDERVSRDLALTQAVLAHALLNAGDTEQALALHSKAALVIGAPHSAQERVRELDPLLIAALGAEISEIRNDVVALVRFHEELRQFQVLPDVPVERSQKRFVSCILKHLNLAGERCDLYQSALIASRALRLIAQGCNESDVTTWRIKSSQILKKLKVESSIAIELSGALQALRHV
jgi:tetratricopeptide (TPR) repeat protein